MPPRRPSRVVGFEHTEANGNKSKFVGTFGFYLDGRLGEVFIDAPKNDSQIGAICHDAAVVLSIALQHGASIAELRDAVARTKLERGQPQSVIGTVIDVMAKEETADE
ncbi:hypothetical protein MesoLjLc_51420 [Mesorhizobium sp. L-8-10]|nr:hypothetical protein MesoLjLc_51420 [Mesorhizobium sp. L-8-10]